MIVYIEHFGTEDHNKLVKEIEDYLYLKHGIETKEIIRRVPNISLYDANLQKIVELSSIRSLQDIDYFLNFLTKEE